VRLPVNGISLNVEIRGTGAPLVLLHGFTGSAATWRSRHFDNRYQLIAIDLLGHGESESPADPARYSIEHCAQDLLTLFDYLRLDQVNLLGYSMGGRVA
jgi:2-succinyl-6-hydroxy-2,4-cyclohexadiene-1-carboxylate synthase